MNQHQTITPAQLSALQSDIETRIELQRRLSEHRRDILAIEYGVSHNTVTAIERGQSQHPTVPAESVMEIRRRRAIWRLTDEQMDDYTLQALADKHGVCTKTVVNQVRAFRLGFSAQRRAA